MKRKSLYQYAKETTGKSSSDATPLVSKRATKRERLQRLIDIKDKALSDHRLINSLCNVFRPHWSTFIFWPAIGSAWGAVHHIDCGVCDFPLLGALVGGGVALLFYFGENKFSLTILALYGLLAGYTFAILTGDSENAVVYASIGFVLGLFGRFFVGLLFRYSQAL